MKSIFIESLYIIFYFLIEWTNMMYSVISNGEETAFMIIDCFFCLFLFARNCDLVVLSVHVFIENKTIAKSKNRMTITNRGREEKHTRITKKR